jgi:hypothetical protein
LTFLRFREETKKLTRTVRASHRFLEENSATVQYSLLFHRYNHFNKRFIKTVDSLVTGGLTQKIESDQVGPKLDRDDEQNAQPLTFEHLELCFAAFMICLGLCCVVFVIEFVIGRRSK